MEYMVFLQPHAQGGFAASTPAIPGCESLGATEEEALRNITANIKDFLRKARFIFLNVDENGAFAKDPWDEVIGMFDDDETFDDFQNEILKYRKSVNN